MPLYSVKHLSLHFLFPWHLPPLAPGDFDDTPVTVTFEPNDLDFVVETARIDTVEDALVERSEYFSAYLATPQATEELTVLLDIPFVAQVRILDNEGREWSRGKGMQCV